MIVLDTDHLSALQFTESADAAQLARRLEAAGHELIATTIVTVEEQLRGWLASIHSRSKVVEQIPYYQRLEVLIRFYGQWNVLPLDVAAASEFDRLKKERLRLGTMDLKIAGIALSRGATLLTANLRDFRQVPGLNAEDWLHS